MFAGKKSAQIREILISESAWEEMTCLFAPSLKELGATGIEMIDYVIPQTDMVRIIGGDYAGLICVGKGGLTGPEDIISIIVDRIYQEAQQ
ncbi:hypothetical protein RCE49_20480 [Klebsiella pneumoniae]|uniref:hypothetical protein n=1 Tax=Klebsiella pneumoniae TaxID=573 RepID=UPI00115C791B|nr:hypothetical protein [Klebsiella pneumoniae]MDQ5123257.1 hypothetical protein [Klebsiella pneumoniae]